MKIKNVLMAVTGSAILAFGLFNIHNVSSITEGGVLGASLLLENWFGITPAISSFILNLICYCIGAKILGKNFVLYSLVSAVAFSLFYAVCEYIGPLFPQISDYKLLCSVLGSVFVGLGVGVCVRVQAAPSGDDALALSFSDKFKIKIETVYIISDIIILILSLTYIPISEIWYSFITIFLSGKIIGYVQRL